MNAETVWWLLFWGQVAFIPVFVVKAFRVGGDAAFSGRLGLIWVISWWGKVLCDAVLRDWVILPVDTFFAVTFTQRWWRDRKNKKKWLDLATGVVKDIGHRLIVVPSPKEEPT